MHAKPYWNQRQRGTQRFSASLKFALSGQVRGALSSRQPWPESGSRIWEGEPVQTGTSVMRKTACRELQ